MLYILGVAHRFQSYHDKRFSDYITTKVINSNIKLIGEEYSTDNCKMYHPLEGSQLFQMAKSLERKHTYCDPTEEERTKLGIETETQIRERLSLSFRARIVGTKEHDLVKKEMKKQWILREKEWLRRLNNENYEKISTLFVLGNCHTKRFSELVGTKNVPFTILDVEEFKH